MKRSFKYALFASLILLPSLTFRADAAGGGDSSYQVDKAIARITGSKIYVAVQGVNVPIANWDGFSGMMAVDAGLEIDDKDLRERTQALMPRVRDTIRQSLHIYMNASYVEETVPDLEAMCKRMQKAVDRMLGPGKAKVTISSAIIHPYS